MDKVGLANDDFGLSKSQFKPRNEKKILKRNRTTHVQRSASNWGISIDKIDDKEKSEFSSNQQTSSFEEGSAKANKSRAAIFQPTLARMTNRKTLKKIENNPAGLLSPPIIN